MKKIRRKVVRNMTGVTGAIVWLIVSAVFFLIEGVTIQLVSTWFAVGSLFAMMTAFIGAPFWVQLLIFLVTSIAVLIIGRPLLMERIKPRKVPTNSDRVIGQIGIVQEQIDNMSQTGRIHVDGLDWTARSLQGEIIPVGEKVIVRHIEGVKLIVQMLRKPVKQEPVPTPLSVQQEEE